MTNYVVSAGQTSSGAVINFPDFLTVLSGGNTFGTIAGGAEIVSYGGVAVGSLLAGYGNQMVDGGIASGTQVNISGTESVGTGGLTVDASVSGTDATEEIDLGGKGLSITVFAGGTVSVYGTAIGTAVSNGGTIVNHGTEISATIYAGGTETVSTLPAFPSALAIGTVLSSGGALTIGTSGTASGVMISSGSTETVSARGVDYNSIISSGGTEIVLSGGASYFDTVMDGGTLIVASGGAAYDRQVYVLSSGQSISGFVVDSSITLDVMAGGYAYGTIVNLGGTENVESGGLASGSVVNGGGLLEVASGGVVYATTVNNGDTTGLQVGYVFDEPVDAGYVYTPTTSGLFFSPPGYFGGLNDYGNPVEPGLAFGSETLWGTTIVFGEIGPAGTLTIDSGGTASGVVIRGGNGVVFGGSITNLQLSDSIVSKSYVDVGHGGIAFSGGFSFGLAGMLEVQSGGIVASALISSGGTITVDTGGALTGATVLPGGVVDTAGGAITACFAAGTRVTTEVGEISVERLDTGTRIRSAFGGAVPVQWIGQRNTDCLHHPRPWDVWPVRVVRHAFAQNQPARDLLLSPDHALYLDHKLVPVRYLLNGASIRQEEVDRVQYFHVELPAHDVIFAEGLPVESYLDTGNRAAFTNGGTATMLHPDFALQVWQSSACAPLLHAGAGVTDIRARLLARATELGFHQTEDADLHLVVEGNRIDPVLNVGRAEFLVPATTSPIILTSRADAPALLHAAHPDHRRLGVSVVALSADGRDIPLSACGGAGWHAEEAGFRWTDGAASLCLPGTRRLVVTLGPAIKYWEAPLVPVHQTGTVGTTDVG